MFDNTNEKLINEETREKSIIDLSIEGTVGYIMTEPICFKHNIPEVLNYIKENDNLTDEELINQINEYLSLYAPMYMIINKERKE